MKNYNTGLKYNSRVNFNSASYFIVQVSDNGVSSDLISPLSLSLIVNDTAIANELETIQNVLSEINDSGIGLDDLVLTIEYLLSDNGLGNDVIVPLNLIISIAETSNATDIAGIINTLTPITEIGIGADSILHIAIERNYNTKFSYNSKVKYNTRIYHVDMPIDIGLGEDVLSNNVLSNVLDAGNGADGATVLATPTIIIDNADSIDTLVLKANSSILDIGLGEDVLSDKKYPANEYFIVTTGNILNPLGVRVIGDNRQELIPTTRDNTEEIPGMHGELDFGSEFKARAIELKVVTKNGLTPIEKAQFMRKFAQYLNPIKGTKKLIFLDDPDVFYNVKYSGKIEPQNYPTFFDFTIPFKMSNPIIEGTEGKTLVGSGVLDNNGTFETGLIIKVAGPVTNPSIVIGGDILTYNGNLTSNEVLVLDTFKQTAKIGNINAMANYNGIFPLLYPNEIINVTAGSNVTINWHDKFI